MEKKFNKVAFILLIVMGIVFFGIGGTFAYLSASVENTTTITGASYAFDVDLEVTTDKGLELIPVADNLIASTLASSHVCEDTRGYGLCNIYHITLTNHNSAQSMYGYLKTVSSTYTTSNLKYQLYTRSGNTYTAASDATAVSHTTDAQNEFRSSGSMVMVSLSDGSTTADAKDYYLVIWISDPGSNQLDDQNKLFTGQVVFVSTQGEQIKSTFISTGQ